MPRVWVVTLGLYALIGGFLSFLGWWNDRQQLTDWFRLGISIQPNSTIAAIFSGAALLSVAFGYKRVGAAFGMVVLLVGSTALVQWVTPVDFERLNTFLLFDRQWGRTGVIDPGRMGPPGATSWTLIGIAAVLLASKCFST